MKIEKAICENGICSADSALRLQLLFSSTKLETVFFVEPRKTFWSQHEACNEKSKIE